MTIRHILDAKGRDVVTVEAGSSVAEAAARLNERKIGAVVVLDPEGGVLGILSERDVVRLGVAQGAAGLERKVSDTMTSKVVTGRDDMGLDEAMGLMTKGRFRHLPICEGGRLVGLISIGDAVKYRLEEAVREAEEMRSYIHTA